MALEKTKSFDHQPTSDELKEALENLQKEFAEEVSEDDLKESKLTVWFDEENLIVRLVLSKRDEEQ